MGWEEIRMQHHNKSQWKGEFPTVHNLKSIYRRGGDGDGEKLGKKALLSLSLS